MATTGSWKIDDDDTVQVDDKKKDKGYDYYPTDWTAVIVSLWVIAAVTVSVTIAANFLHKEDKSEVWGRQHRYELPDVLDRPLFIEDASAPDKWKATHWIADGRLVHWDAAGGISAYDATTDRVSVLIPALTLVTWPADEFWPSEDGRHILLHQSLDSLPGHHQALYAVYNTVERYLTKLQFKKTDLEATVLEHASWMGNSHRLVAVYERNVYLIDDIEEQQWRRVNAEPWNGDVDQLNGLPDWTLSEGVHRHRSLLWPSPDGDWLLYGVLNTSLCHRIDYVDYSDDLPRSHTLRYAVPDGPLAQLELRQWNALDGTEKELPISQVINRRQWLLVQVQWLGPLGYVSLWTSRHQNSHRIVYCHVTSYECQEVFAEKAAPSQRLDIGSLFSTTTGDKREFLYVSRPDNGDGQRVLHFQQPWHQTTPLSLDADVRVDRVVAWDAARRATYFLGGQVAHERHLMSVDEELGLRCLTCQLQLDGCTYVDVGFRPHRVDTFELQCLGPQVPSAYVVRCDGGGGGCVPAWPLRHIDDGLQLQHLRHLTPAVRYVDVELSGGDGVRVQLLLPHSWRDKRHHHLRYPLLVHLLNWDEEDEVSDRWRLDWSSYLTTTRQVVYGRVLGRETGHRYGQLHFAAEDVVSVTRHITAEYPQVDPESVLVLGRGVAGYVATLTLARDEEHLFRCAVAITPTVEWFRVETTVAERYLGSVRDTFDHYVTAKLDGQLPGAIRNDSLLLMDQHPFSPVDQYHIMKLSQLLVKAGVGFQQKVYPRVGAEAVRYHQFMSMEHFINHCLLDQS